jgi:molecular chaperone DnaK (HSP70)
LCGCHDWVQWADLFRRLIGRRFEDETVTKDIKSWPFKVVDQGGSPLVEVEYLGEKKQFSPQEISAMVLVKVRHTPPFDWWGSN